MAILRLSTRVGITCASVPSPLLRPGALKACNTSRWPARRTVLERISSSNTARGDTSPPYSLTSRSNEDVPPRESDLGCPPVINLRSVNHPLTTRSAGMGVVESGAGPVDDRLSVRLISFLDKPVRAAIFEWLTLPFRSRAWLAAARMKASRARLEKLFGVMPRGSRASASSPSKSCRSVRARSVGA